MQSSAATDVSYANSQMIEIHEQMKKANGSLYISGIDIGRVMSLDTIRRIVLTDSSMSKISLKDKVAFVRDVQERAPKL